MDNGSKKQEMFSKMQERKSEVKIVRKIVAIIAIVFVLLLVIVGFLGYNYVKSALKPVDPDSTKTIAVEVPIGSSLSSISTLLEKKGVIKDARVFKYYAKFKNESQFQAGTYDLTKAMTLDELIESLKTGKVYRKPVFTMTIPEGLTLEQIGNIVEKKTPYTQKEFMDLVTSDAFVQKMMANYPELVTDAVLADNIRYDLEGYLFPATYSYFEEKPSLESIVEEMIGAMDKVVKNYSDLLAEKQMSVHQLVTFASLLEEEATAQTDRETIASVFYNRLDQGMPLQTDPTVLYALGSHKNRVLYEDLEVENAYNTYKNKGLPPGPIAGAGKSSIEAALNPSSTDYLYFLADKEGVNHFSKTYDEHLQKVEKYLRKPE
ncbi:endolytic transglycosylase MltG [Lysinibacillus pakistanensis]|uniref:Endolytic murein transglycosylase n=1 Tax=Lysinibacillus pakistanensis TaxID=759811 RepID=A0AAX3WUT3_9BACI|nr:endolytic transglycosylase MltG [Lysinibacillus pakistanensis]MDM5234567.1 endolytic transglycosylase MltG [Lysinibacillus pakistanensis]WHY45143.1 endolytic transglycosylase MltG [Lysinibacillus pakistanensis]WHY50152.1 endolytic transglycosylase MltG [Lysinibacillus pakistanensis]